MATRKNSKRAAPEPTWTDRKLGEARDKPTLPPSDLGAWHAQATIHALEARGLLTVAEGKRPEVITALAGLYDHARESAARSIGEAVIETGKALFRAAAKPAAGTKP